MKPEPHKPAPPPQPPAAPSFITQHISIQHAVHRPPQLHPAAAPGPSALAVVGARIASRQPLAPAHLQMVAASGPHPTVIARASVSHPSVIQAVNHVLQQGGGAKHGAHPPVGRITVHPVARLAPRLPALYAQGGGAQSAVVGHIAHTLGHAHPHMNGAAAGQPAAAKQTAVSAQMVTHHPHHPHHPQLVGQAVLNPVTMVSMPSFPIGTLKLA
ncbi:Max-binding protein MNT [Liparis tanakae]|uniref:Max-binding protein MNT n=1 Tax=Liparis tanakae TaxID=230148 RepID=A0A4Z2DZE1_9TELE|nr:Max-binding protein MNT [Liparis tanakae]